MHSEPKQSETPRRRRHDLGRIAALLVVLVIAGLPALAQTDPLPSWNPGPTKQAIVDFVTRVTTPGGPDYVEVGDRIATFDNDGTLWVEQPVYAQGFFVADRVRALGRREKGLLAQPPFQAVIAKDDAALAALGEGGIAKLVIATHSGMTTDAFDGIVRNWFETAMHPRFGRRFDELAYQPMLELLAYLRDQGFKTFIVSGGGVEFMRAFAEETYGVPPEQVIGSSGRTRFEMRGGRPVLEKLPEIAAVDDGEGKPVNINLHIGRRPIFAAGNSDGDLQMLQWTTMAPGPRFALIIHHTDGEREYAYDRLSSVGRLDRALDEAAVRGWTVVDMKRDWASIFPNE